MEIERDRRLHQPSWEGGRSEPGMSGGGSQARGMMEGCPQASKAENLNLPSSCRLTVPLSLLLTFLEPRFHHL